MSDEKRTATVGIDLGTTWSVIATVDDYGQPQILTNGEGDWKTPSVVMFEEGNPETVVGKVAMASAKAMPTRVVSCAKREIGREPARQYEMDGKTYRPEEISALVLRKLKQDAEMALGGDVEVKRAVITVPAYFDESRRLATRAAGELAGLEVIGILDEPVAAAIAYSADKAEQSQTIAVYDLGGGTFDVTVMRIDRGKVSVLAKGGNAELGGKDWDDAIVKHAAEQFEAKYGSDPTDDAASYQSLYDTALMAKESLSRVGKARITVSAGDRLVVELPLEEFHSLTSDLLDQTKNTLEGILQGVPGINGWDDVDKVLLVGGSTRMKQVRQMVAEVTGKEPSTELDPDKCVAEGAAFYAFGRLLEIVDAGGQQGSGDRNAEDVKDIEGEIHLLGPGTKNIPKLELEFASSRFYGVRALDGNMAPINSILIRKNDRIPSKESATFGTSAPGMTEIPIIVLECEEEEENPDAPGIKVVREGQIAGIPPGLPQGAPIDVTFEFLNDGTLKVHAVERTHGKQCHIDANPKGGMTEREMEQAKEKQLGLVVT